MSEPPVHLDLADLGVSPTAALFEGKGNGAGISMFVTHTPVNAAVPIHVHPYPETFVLLRGTGRWTAGEHVAELEPEQLIVVPANTPHGFRNIGEESLLVVSVHENDEVVQEWLGRDPA